LSPWGTAADPQQQKVAELERRLRALQDVVLEMQRQHSLSTSCSELSGGKVELHSPTGGSAAAPLETPQGHRSTSQWPILRSLDTMDDLVSRGSMDSERTVTPRAQAETGMDNSCSVTVAGFGSEAEGGERDSGSQEVRAVLSRAP
jgi:hypothetical protein